MINKKRKPQINFPANLELIKELKQISKIIEIPYAQIAREAIREKITQIKTTDSRFQRKEQSKTI